jgi:predicted metal-dependent peptidase
MVKARTALILEQPFFGSLALRLALEERPDIGTMATDGKRLIFAPSFVLDQKSDHLKTIVAHEVMHVALSHNTRRGNREHDQWNEAGDYAINPLLVAAGFPMPDHGLLDAEYAGKSAEEIYAARRHKPDPDGDQQDPAGAPGDQQGPGSPQQAPGQGQQPASDPGEMGAVMDLPGETGDIATESEKKQAEAEMRVAVKQAAQAAKAAGKLPGDLERAVTDVLNPMLPWKEILSRFLDTCARNDFSWFPPNRRYVHQGIYLPSIRSAELPPIVIAVDTSGSITPADINQFSAEISAIAEDLPISTVKILYCDTDVTEGPEYTKDDLPIHLQPQGGGGTDFRPVFTHIAGAHIEPACLIYITDGEGEAPEHAPPYDVLWALTQDTPPAQWGERLNLRKW